MQSFVKIGFAQISLAAMPKISELPKIWGGGGLLLQPPTPNGTYAYGCYHLFFHLNTL